MVNKIKTYILLFESSILVAVLIAIFGNALDNLSTVNSGYEFLSSIVFLLTFIQVGIILYEEVMSIFNDLVRYKPYIFIGIELKRINKIDVIKFIDVYFNRSSSKYIVLRC